MSNYHHSNQRFSILLIFTINALLPLNCYAERLNELPNNISIFDDAIFDSDNYNEFQKIITKKKISLQTKFELITFPFGSSIDRIIEIINKNDRLNGHITKAPKEGTLLPASYIFVQGETRDNIIAQMASVQERIVQEIWDKRNPKLAINSKQEFIILASIIERETAIDEEYPKISAVLQNRLKQKMRLESDTTVLYGLLGGKGNLGRALTKQDLDISTPYNTYLIDGLPFGPICNPSIIALKAAANPSDAKHLYYVANGKGGHLFADTYEQHIQNVKSLITKSD